jgi:hypothetical protein
MSAQHVNTKFAMLVRITRRIASGRAEHPFIDSARSRGGLQMPKGATTTKTLAVGDRAPEFRLKSHLDQDISLTDLRGKNVFIAFYPLDWTPV